MRDARIDFTNGRTRKAPNLLLAEVKIEGGEGKIESSRDREKGRSQEKESQVSCPGAGGVCLRVREGTTV